MAKEVRNQCDSDIETLSVLKDLPSHVTNENFMAKKVISINITNEDIKKETYKSPLITPRGHKRKKKNRIVRETISSER